MATGKTTVAKILAKKLGYRFIDIDEEIERFEGKSINTIFETEGESYFRKIEAKATKKISGLSNHVIACGGGVVMNEDNVKALKNSSKMVLLTATPQEILKRIEGNRTRPLLEVENKLIEITSILEKRQPTYKRMADIEIDTTQRSPNEIVDIIIKQVRLD
jgi:shikimate kinase